MKDRGQWIWLNEEYPKQNHMGCFAEELYVEDLRKDVSIRISADTRYALYCNGFEIGRGPIRAMPNNWYYDTYDLTPWLTVGKNHIAIRVWNYGISNYQYFAHKPGLWYEVYRENQYLKGSSEQTKSALDKGIISDTVKRNANMGFIEHYDANYFESDWIKNSELCQMWIGSRVVEDSWGKLSARPIKLFHSEMISPQKVVSFYEGCKKGQQVSLNLRDIFFPERIDINATIFTGFLAMILESPKEMEGKIIFPNRTWNGIFGDFKINHKYYETSNSHRDIEVVLEEGKQLFLMQISGKFDDLFCHIEYLFPEEIKIESFWGIGPTEVIEEVVDGKSKIYGGLQEFDRFQQHISYHDTIFASNSIEELNEHKSDFKYIKDNAIFWDEYLYSNIKNHEIIKTYTVTNDMQGLVWNNSESTMIDSPLEGDSTYITVDFGDIYLGTMEFIVYAEKDTKIEIYGYENQYGGEIDLTVGLNNSMTYICKEGYQTYKGMSRMGARYLIIRISNYSKPVKFYHIGMLYSTYAASGIGEFRCSDALLEKIWNCSKHTHLLCMEDVFTDCPTYEQAFWIGDAQISACVNAMVFGEYALMKHVLELAAETKYNTPILNALGPTDWTTNIPMWTMNWMLAIKQYVEVTGDSTVLSNLYKEVKGVLDYFGTLINKDGLFVIQSWNMIDWAPMDLENQCACTAQQAILSHCYEYYADVAKSLGYSNDAELYSKYGLLLTEGIDQYLWDKDRNIYIDGWSPSKGNSKTVSIQTHLMIVLFGATKDKKKKEIAMQYLVKQPDEFVKIGSPFILFYFYEIFAKNKEFQFILDDMKTRWGDMLRYDCTTCWEVFPGFYEVGRTRSYCHSWSSAPVYFCNRYFLGVNRVQNGDDVISLSVPDISLDWCEGSIPSVHGSITVRWEKTGSQKKYKIEVPKTIVVDKSMMDGWEVKITAL